MFSGIIERTGIVKEIALHPGGVRLIVDLGESATGVKAGDSIAIDGVCLTVVNLNGSHAAFDVITETLSKTTLGKFVVGSPVNLERSLMAGARIDGHFVQGHVDDVGVVAEKVATDAEYKLWIEVPEALHVFVVPRGSIAVNGVSLTIAEVNDSRFAVALTPTTLELTNLGRLVEGDAVNLETDVVARQIVHYLQTVSSQAKAFP